MKFFHSEGISKNEKFLKCLATELNVSPEEVCFPTIFKNKDALLAVMNSVYFKVRVKTSMLI